MRNRRAIPTVCSHLPTAIGVQCLGASFFQGLFCPLAVSLRAHPRRSWRTQEFGRWEQWLALVRRKRAQLCVKGGAGCHPHGVSHTSSWQMLNLCHFCCFHHLHLLLYLISPRTIKTGCQSSVTYQLCDMGQCMYFH